MSSVLDGFTKRSAEENQLKDAENGIAARKKDIADKRAKIVRDSQIVNQIDLFSTKSQEELAKRIEEVEKALQKAKSDIVKFAPAKPKKKKKKDPKTEPPPPPIEWLTARKNKDDFGVLLRRLKGLQENYDTRVAFAKEQHKYLNETKKKLAEVVDEKKELEETRDKLTKPVTERQEIIGKDTQAWDRDQKGRALRNIEEDLQEMQRQLKKFKKKKLGVVSSCKEYANLESHVNKLEEYVDHRAHRAKCHKCKNERSIERSKRAKTLIELKIKYLESLEGKPKPKDALGFS